MNLHELVKRCSDDRPGWILRQMCTYDPLPRTRNDLMKGARIFPHIDGPVCSYAAFHWWVLRINDDIRLFGWKIVGGAETNHLYRLQHIR